MFFFNKDVRDFVRDFHVVHILVTMNMQWSLKELDFEMHFAAKMSQMF